MQHVNNLANIENYRSPSEHSRTSSVSRPGSGGSGSSGKASSGSVLSDKAMAHLWKRMIAIYGHRWHAPLGPCVDGNGRLSESALTWQAGLSGLSLEQIKGGLEAMLRNADGWPPSLPEFRELCLKSTGGAPDLAEVVRLLANASSREGSLVDRYRHPLVLAIAREVDMYALRTASTERAFRIVGPAYKRLVAEGWPGWPEHAHERPRAIGHDRPVNRAAALAGIAGLRSALGGLPS